MLSNIKSCTLIGVDGYLIHIETDIVKGMPNFIMVGLPDASVKESKDRIASALKNSGFQLPTKRITVNLAPGNIKKEGTLYDVPIALGIMLSSAQLQPKIELEKTLAVGELALDGSIRGVDGTLPMIIEAKRHHMRRVIVPYENRLEACLIDGIEIIAVKNLKELAKFLSGESDIAPLAPSQDKFFEHTFHLDYSDVKGQENAKRAMEVAAAGAHNMLMIGPPGSGKTMLARCFPSILPDMTKNESLEVTKIYSIAGLLRRETPLITTRPYRSPHHTISDTSLTGGGRIPRPGEVSLAHLGVLFLDELPEFQKTSLEALRQPLEDKIVTISRVNATITYPSSFMLLASMNPCPCGYFGDESNRCHCSSNEIKRYLGKISGPMLDRIDIHIEVPSTSYDKLKDRAKTESSANIKKRVDNARTIQLQRYQGTDTLFNSSLNPRQIELYCRLGENEEKLMKKAFTSLNLSSRAYHRILKLARTIADLDNSEDIKTPHIAEAVQYRSLDRKYWL